jgi:hypothetical protein
MSIQSIQQEQDSTKVRLKTFEYCSIDVEARSRRNNLIFRGIHEAQTSEDCYELTKAFLKDNLHIDPDSICIQRAHRLGAFAHGKYRPIVVCFRDCRDVENILSCAYKLKGKKI